jgi:hypothetical protein
VGVYIPPQKGLNIYGEYLDSLGDLIRLRYPRPVLVAGNFNAKSPEWGCPREDGYGRVLGCWAAALGLVIINTESRSICVRPQGRSIVDLIWASPSAAQLVTSWKVVTDADSLSNHRFIRIGIRATLSEVLSRRAMEKLPRR